MRPVLGHQLAEGGTHSDASGSIEGHAAGMAHIEQAVARLAAPGVSLELVDVAGDEHVGWSQWTYHLPGGDVTGWSLNRVRDGQISDNADFVDTVALAALTS